jgi:hypothetical protein
MASTPEPTERRPDVAWFRPGDLVATRDGYPTLYEVVSVDPEGLLRVRGLNWQPGYSAVIDAASVRLVTGALR